MHDDPVDSEPLMQTLEVNKLKIVPTLERFDLFLPSAGKCREHADGTAVFDGIGEPGALGNGTKSVLVFAGQSHKVGIEAKVGVDRGLVPNPEKRFDPGVPGCGSG